MTGGVRHVARPRETSPAERPLCDLPLRGAAEGTAPVFHLQYAGGGLPGHPYHCILVCKEITAFNSIVGVFFPVIVMSSGMVAKGCVDPSLGGYGVGPQGMDLGEDRDAHVPLVHGNGRSQASQPSPDHYDLMIPQGILLRI